MTARDADLLALLADQVAARLAEHLADGRDSEPGAAPPERWLKVREVAELVGSCERTVYRALNSGALAGERLGSHWRIRPAAVDAWLAAEHERPQARPETTTNSASHAPRETTFRDRLRDRERSEGRRA